MGCDYRCSTGHTYTSGCLFTRDDLHTLRAAADRTVAVAYLHIKGGGVLEFEDVRPDSIGPSAVHPGVIGVEFESGAVEVAHVPFVEWWHIEYR